MMERTRSMALGVMVERREVDHPWQSYAWRPVAVIPGAPQTDAPRQLNEEDGRLRYHAATLPLDLHRKEAEAYKANLSNDPPQIYIVLRPNDDSGSEIEIEPFLVTASPYEAQDYLDSGEDIVEGVTMPDSVIAWVQAFVDRHYIEEPFKKRARKRHEAHEAFARPPSHPSSDPSRKANGHD